jgi:hypothetical protein
MIKKFLIVSGAMLFAASAVAQGTSPGASGSTPGHKMQKSTTSTGPGASGQMKSAKKSKAPGASEYAPGQQTTTGTAKTKKY